MHIEYDRLKESENLVKKLLNSIQEATQAMNHTYEETVLRHEEQFIKCYRIKISELVKLLEELKGTIQGKFINNTLAIQLDTVLKERDYFKYQCLKLNSQHQTLLDDHKNLTAQANNASEQISIYKHLLQTEKIKSNQVENNVDKLKKNLAEIAIRSLPEVKSNHDNKIPEVERYIVKLKRQIRQKNETIRALRERVQDLERAANLEHGWRVEKKEMYELWRICVQGWRREAQSKGKKEDSKLFSKQQLSITSKKQLLRMFFSHSEFLKFIERLIFEEGFQVVFESSEQNYMQRNREKLVDYMCRKQIYSSQKGLRM